MPISVYCYLRPGQSEDRVLNGTSISCRAVGQDTVVLTPPSTDSQSDCNELETRYIFRRVFTEKSTYSQMFVEVCAPLLTDVLAGRDALLFTYGASGSGKTHLMNGTSVDPGILPRCIDTIFNSIVLMDKYCLSKNAVTNEFTRVTDADRMLERQKRDLLPLITSKPSLQARGGPMNRSCVQSDRSRDGSKIICGFEDSRFAVFVSYIEIYNRYVYDLLDAENSFQSKALKEDRTGRVFVRDGIEVEVRSADEALQWMAAGNAMRHSGRTDLNASSSRSHAVFTIRLVRVDSLTAGDEHSVACVSQLSLVDMAGSERTNKANTEGTRLREAGHINTSLLVLRNCFRVLQSQTAGQANSVVPYRDCKLTSLFKHFFEGYGRIIMLICVNPSEYEENVHVMKFAEASQQIRPAQPLARPLNTYRLRQTAESVKRPLGEIQDSTPRKVQRTVPADLVNQIVKLSSFPKALESAQDENSLVDMCTYLDKRSKEVKSFLEKQIEEVRSMHEFVNQLISDNRQLSAEVCVRRNSEATYKLAIGDLESQLQQMSSEVEHVRARQAHEKGDCKQQLKENVARIRSLTCEVERLQSQLNSATKQRHALERNFAKRIEQVKLESSRLLDRELQQRHDEFSSAVSKRDAVIRKVHEILHSGDGDFVSPYPVGRCTYRTECTITPEVRRYPSSSITTVTPLTTTTSFSNTVVPDMSQLAMRNFRRSLLAKTGHRWRSADVWIDHRPVGTVETDGILQPLFRKRRSVSCISLHNTRSANKYALTDQLQTKQGDMITRLVKGEILSSPSGGANVVFTDVETVRLESPRTKLSCLTEIEPSLSSNDSSRINELRHWSSQNSGSGRSHRLPARSFMR